jgi:hypothetical protein
MLGDHVPKSIAKPPVSPDSILDAIVRNGLNAA